MPKNTTAQISASRAVARSARVRAQKRAVATLPPSLTMVTTKTRTTKATRPSARAMLRPRRALRAAAAFGVGIAHQQQLQRRAARDQVLDQQGGEQQEEVEDREGEQVARVLGAGLDVVEAVVVALVRRVAGVAAEQPHGQQQEDQRRPAPRRPGRPGRPGR